MRTRAPIVVDSLMIFSLLLGVGIVPIFFNIHAYRSFPLDKALLVQLLGVLLLGAIITREVHSRFSIRRSVYIKTRGLFVAIWAPLALYLFVTFASTVFSINKYSSLFGSYGRMEGLLSFMSYIIIFFAVLLMAEQHVRFYLLIDASVISGLIVSLYGLMQHFGLGTIDAAVGGTYVQKRIIATLGNPIFLADYLVVVSFLSLYRLVDIFMRSETEWDEHTLRNLVLASMFMFALVLQVIAIFLSQSRTAALTFFVIVCSTAVIALFFLGMGKMKKVVLYSLVALILVIAVYGLVVRDVPREQRLLREIRYVPAVGRLSLNDRNTQARLEIWESAIKILSPTSRLKFPPDFDPDPQTVVHHLVGYGPDTLRDVFTQFLPISEFWRRKTVDRAHNEFLDVGIGRGLLGLLAYIWFFVGLIYVFLASMFNKQREIVVARAVGVVLGFVVLGAALVVYVDGSFRLVFPMIPWFAVVGLTIVAVGLIYVDRSRNGGKKHMSSEELLSLFLGAALMAHYLTQSTSIATATSNVVFWSLSGMMVAWFVQRRSELTTDMQQAKHDEPSTPIIMMLLFAAAIFVSLGYVLVFYIGEDEISAINVLVSNFVRFNYGDVVYYGWPKLIVVALSAISVSVVFSSYVDDRGRNGDFLRKSTILAVFSIFVFFAISLFLSGWYASFAGARKLAKGINSIPIFMTILRQFSISYYLFLLCTVFILIIWVGFRKYRFLQGGSPYIIISIVSTIVISSVFLTMYVIPASIADMYFKYGVLLTNPNQYELAEQVFSQAIKLVGYRDSYYYYFAQSIITDIRETKEHTDTNLGKIQQLLERAIQIDPLNSDSWKNMAVFYLLKRNMTSQSNESDLLGKAVDAARTAVLLWPNNSARRVFYARVLLIAGREEEAFEQIDWVLRMDPKYREAYVLASVYYSNVGDWEQSLFYLKQWLQLAPNDVGALLQIAQLYERTGDLETARSYADRAVDLAPKNFKALYTAATLHKESGLVTSALQLAHRARDLAGDEQQKREIDALIASLQKELGN